MLVHSFSETDASLEDFRAFATQLGLKGADPGRLTSSRSFGDVDLALAWVSDRPSTAVPPA